MTRCLTAATLVCATLSAGPAMATRVWIGPGIPLNARTVPDRPRPKATRPAGPAFGLAIFAVSVGAGLPAHHLAQDAVQDLHIGTGQRHP